MCGLTAKPGITTYLMKRWELTVVDLNFPATKSLVEVVVVNNYLAAIVVIPDSDAEGVFFRIG